MRKDYTLEKRKYIIGGFIVVIVIIFIIRLFSLQVMDSRYKEFADSNAFMHIYNDLMLRNDEFYVLADFEAYLYAQSLVANAYEDRRAWARIMLINIAKSGYFYRDRTIQEYAREIWGLTPIPFETTGRA